MSGVVGSVDCPPLGDASGFTGRGGWPDLQATNQAVVRGVTAPPVEENSAVVMETSETAGPEKPKDCRCF